MRRTFLVSVECPVSLGLTKKCRFRDDIKEAADIEDHKISSVEKWCKGCLEGYVDDAIKGLADSWLLVQVKELLEVK